METLLVWCGRSAAIMGKVARSKVASLVKRHPTATRSSLRRALRVASRPRKFAALTESLVLLLTAEAVVRLGGLNTAARWFGASVVFTHNEPGHDTRSLGLSLSQRRRLVVLARVAGRWPLSPSGSCLRHSLAAAHILRARKPNLRLGVGNSPDAKMTAHAWLEVDGIAVTYPGNYLPLVRHRGEACGDVASQDRTRLGAQ